MEKSFKRATAFISSTFVDMADERNLMTYNVLPRIKKWAFDRGVIFDVVDLRWGINDEQANDLHHTIKLCLQNVKDSEPIFVCFIGERYGWIPPVEDFNQSMFAKNIDKYKNLSATELEIVEALGGALLDSPPKSCLFLMRNPLDFDGIPSEVAKIYKDKTNAELLNNLKDSIDARKDIAKHDYSARFSYENITYSLDDFMCEQTPLEDIIFEELKKILIDRYGISNESITIFDNILTRQQYHHNELLLYPKIEHLQGKLNEFLLTTPEYGYTPIGVPRGSAIFSQIAHFIESRLEDKNQRTIYRYWGLNMQIDSINDLICSIAYEFSNDKKHLDNPLESLLYLKKHLEEITQNTLLIVVGMPYTLLPDYFNTFLGFKWIKQLVFYDIGNLTQTELTIDCDETSFEKLAKFMFERKAKSLTQTQFNKVLQTAKKNYSSLKLIVDYLCNFAQYETLDHTINSISSLDDFGMARRYLNGIMAVQNSHAIKGIMSDVIELLCHSPLPLSKEDIVDAICLARDITTQPEKKQIDKEVAFSLRLASSLIDEYNSRFKITDETITTLAMFKENGEPKESALIIALRSVYLERLTKNGNFNSNDAQNLLEIIKDYSDGQLKTYLVLSVFNNTDIFYKLAKALDKKHLVDFFKTLAMQSLGHNVDSYFTRKVNNILGANNDKINYATAIMQGKLFSLAKTLHKDNIFINYYLAVLKINDDDLSSAKKSAQSLNSYLSAENVGCHKLSLPKFINASKNNTCVYTIMDAYKKEYANYICFCQDGFLIVCDIYTGEMEACYIIPRNLGEVVSAFYQEHTIHIVFEKSALYTIHLWSKQTNIHRILPENMCANSFLSYYSKGLQVAVADDRRIVLYVGGRIANDIGFSPSYSILSAYGINAKDNEFPMVCAIAKDSYGLTYVYSIDMHTHKIIDQHVFIEKDVIHSVQDEHADDVYITLDDGTSYVVSFDEDGMLDVRDTNEQCHFSLKGKYAITQVGEQIKYNGELIATDKGVKCCFSSRSLIAVITNGNTLYVIDNGY